MHGGSSKTGSCGSLSYTSWSQYLQYQSILIMVGEITSVLVVLEVMAMSEIAQEDL